MTPGKCQLDMMRDNIENSTGVSVGILCPRCGGDNCRPDYTTRDHLFNRDDGTGWAEEDYFCATCHWRLGLKRAKFRLRKEVVNPKPGGMWRLVPVAYVRVD